MIMRSDAEVGDEQMRDFIVNNINKVTKDILERKLDTAYPPQICR